MKIITMLIISLMLFVQCAFAESIEERITRLEERVSVLEKMNENVSVLNNSEQNINKTDVTIDSSSDTHREISINDFCDLLIELKDNEANRKDLTNLQYNINRDNFHNKIRYTKFITKGILQEARMFNETRDNKKKFRIDLITEMKYRNRKVTLTFWGDSEDEDIIALNKNDTIKFECYINETNLSNKTKTAYTRFSDHGGDSNSVHFTITSLTIKILKEETNPATIKKPIKNDSKEIKETKWIVYLDTGGELKVAEKKELEDGQYKLTLSNGSSVIIHRSKFIVEDAATKKRYKYDEAEKKFMLIK